MSKPDSECWRQFGTFCRLQPFRCSSVRGHFICKCMYLVTIVHCGVPTTIGVQKMEKSSSVEINLIVLRAGASMKIIISPLPPSKKPHLCSAKREVERTFSTVMTLHGKLSFAIFAIMTCRQFINQNLGIKSFTGCYTGVQSCRAVMNTCQLWTQWRMIHISGSIGYPRTTHNYGWHYM